VWRSDSDSSFGLIFRGRQTVLYYHLSETLQHELWCPSVLFSLKVVFRDSSDCQRMEGNDVVRDCQRIAGWGTTLCRNMVKQCSKIGMQWRMEKDEMARRGRFIRSPHAINSSHLHQLGLQQTSAKSFIQCSKHIYMFTIDQFYRLNLWIHLWPKMIHFYFKASRYNVSWELFFCIEGKLC